MALYSLVNEDRLNGAIKATTDAIREKTGSEDPIPWNKETGLADAVPAVYEAGEAAGVEVGKQEGTDAFWDLIQEFGTRKDYSYAFCRCAFDYIRPKYKVIPTESGMNQTFAENIYLKKVESAYFDFSQAPNLDYCGYWTFANDTGLEEIEDIGIPAPTKYSYTFTRCRKLHTINILRVLESTLFFYAFSSCASLENITIEGTIGQNGMDLQYSTLLSKASILSIINALSTTTTGLTVTFSLTAVNNAFATATGAADGATSEEWLALVDTKSNWTISLV